MRENIITLSDGRKLGYAEYGQSDGEVVFEFHGTPGSRYQVDATRLESIAKEGPVPLRIIVPERPGYGLSDPKAGRTLEDWCLDIEALSNELGVERFSIVGISGGGPFALACAYRMPTRIRKIAVICGFGPIDVLGQEDLSNEERTCLQGPEFTRIYITQLANKVNADPDGFTEYFISNLPKLDRELISDDLIPIFKPYAVEALRQEEGMVHDFIIFGQPWNIPLQNIRVPVAFWHSEADHNVPISHAEYLASVIPHAELHRIQGYDHTGSVLAAQPELYHFLTTD
ncbi:Pimeloyl-ACP methyl ester carboxylesterase [Paenibacillus tianmuensis]|uniref:Pimeloyl-ACP methyl ester carboxylesterase n=1 Tax=Paenibacillus tianmuensis TaxID=624147 RepID=A0A1G4TT99_9BACL|nr:alpha/beta hydrolase [Paenibacillus tianmuensis]SCW83829.1 Pimeloyl-ACP methyl ester carboxylesterase [Paenibacillus tianmuensis]